MRTITKRTAIDMLRKKQNAVSGGNDGADIEKIPSFESEYDRIWDSEWNSYILAESMKTLRSRVNESTFQAFEMYVIQDVPAEKTAEKLSLSVNQVYQARARSVEILRGIIKELKEV